MHYNITKYLTLICGCIFTLSSYARDKQAEHTGQVLRKPLCFVENKGQVVDETNTQRPDIKYKLSTPGMNLYLGNGCLHYQYKQVNSNDLNHLDVTGYRMDVTLLGANPAAQVVASNPQEYYENYYGMADIEGGFTVHSYNKITYKNVYKNIDWVIYVKNDKVEYDFVVNPGGNANDIKLAYGGATKLTLDNNGALTAETPLGTAIAQHPVAFENGTHRPVDSRFVLNGNKVTFQTGTYQGGITIDPYLLWSTYYGGTAEDVVTSVKQAPGGSVYACGYTASSNAISSAGAYRSAFLGGLYDAFYAKFSQTTGVLQYATYLGGTSTDQAMAIALDNSGAAPNVYMAGYTNSTSFTGGPPVTPAPVRGYTGSTDGFLAKFNNAGTLSWWTYYGGSGNDYFYGLTVDASNNPIVIGQTSSTGIATAGAYQTTLQGLTDAFVAKFSSATGGVTWATYYGGTADETGYGVAVDASGNVYITGLTSSIVDVSTSGAYQAYLNGTNDAFIAKLNAAGTGLTWGTYFGGPGLEQGNAIAYDPVTTHIAVVGYTSSTTGVATSKGCQTSYGGGTQDAFVTYFNNSGTEIWSTYYGGTAPDYGQGLCFDPAGNVIITGGTFSTSGIASSTGTLSANAYQGSLAGNYDAFVAKINTLGQRLWGTYLGGTLYDFANSVFCNSSWQISLGGFTTSTGNYYSGGIATTGANQTSNGGGTYDGFVTMMSVDTLVAIKQTFTDTLVCVGGTLTVNYAANIAFQTTNTFTIQLSDATGSFASPVNIGNVNSGAATGVITCVIPATTTPGTGYRIRITATAPVYISPDEYYNIDVVNTLPATTANATTPTCVGNTLTLSDTASYIITSWSWTGPNGFTSALQNPGIYPVAQADSGSYYIATTHNGCPTVTSSVNVTVNNAPPPMPADSGTTSLCTRNTIYLFSNPDTVATGLTFHWAGPGSFSSNLQNPTITGATTANAGVYTVTDSLGGCPSAVNTIIVDVLPLDSTAISIAASPGDTICAGTLVSFTAIPKNGGTTPHYQWMSGSFSPIVGAMSNTYASSTLTSGETIFCQLTSNATCPFPASTNSNIITMDVIDNPPLVAIYASPSEIVTAGATVTFTSVVADAVAPTYQWMVNGVNAGTNASTFTLTDVTGLDTVSLTVTSSMACAIPNYGVASVVVMPSTGLKNVNATFSGLSLYPNPNSGSFSIAGSVSALIGNEIDIEVINSVGQVVYTGKLPVAGSMINQEIFAGNLADGIYFARVHAGTDAKVFRFTVAH